MDSETIAMRIVVMPWCGRRDDGGSVGSQLVTCDLLIKSARESCPTALIKKLLSSAAALLIAATVQAQPTGGSPDPKTGAEMTGTIKEYSPGTSLVLETLAPSEPVQFKLSKGVTYADVDGKPIETAGLTTNQKVRVHYTKIGGEQRSRQSEPDPQLEKFPPKPMWPLR
ncbi:MAG TPA: hypothetical protein VLO30_07750 [Chthoniobacterales bacterium]|nr:hypothetical protein [Chthoniobacterales bacterium]